MAKLIASDGTVLEIAPKQGNAFTLAELQGYVGGYIQLVGTKDGQALACNEEGKLRGLPVNPVATAEYHYGAVDPIVGTAVIGTWREMGG